MQARGRNPVVQARLCCRLKKNRLRQGGGIAASRLRKIRRRLSKHRKQFRRFVDEVGVSPDLDRDRDREVVVAKGEIEGVREKEADHDQRPGRRLEDHLRLRTFMDLEIRTTFAISKNWI